MYIYIHTCIYRANPISSHAPVHWVTSNVISKRFTSLEALYKCLDTKQNT